MKIRIPKQELREFEIDIWDKVVEVDIDIYRQDLKEPVCAVCLNHFDSIEPVFYCKRDGYGEALIHRSCADKPTIAVLQKTRVARSRHVAAVHLALDALTTIANAVDEKAKDGDEE
jgi:hypothetical protein